MGKQFENLQGAICLNPTDDEATEALGKKAAAAEREASPALLGLDERPIRAGVSMNTRDPARSVPRQPNLCSSSTYPFRRKVLAPSGQSCKIRR
jgi:hypothetical protein